MRQKIKFSASVISLVGTYVCWINLLDIEDRCDDGAHKDGVYISSRSELATLVAFS